MLKLKLGAAVLCALMLAGCGGGGGLGNGETTGGGLGGSTGSTTGGSTTGGSTGSGIPATLTIAAAQASVVADGASTSLLTATLTDTTGVAVTGTDLTFQTNAGSLTAASSKTDSNGQAITRLKAGNTLGRATVTVREPKSGLSANVNVSFVAGPATKVTISLAPAQVRPAGTTSVNVLVTDANNLPVSGELVSLSNSSNISGGQFAASTITTDSNGRASTTYQAGPNIGTDGLQAALAASGASAIASANLSVTASATSIDSITLTAGSATAIADGTTTTTLSAKVEDSSGGAVPGSVVNFATTAGALTAPSATTDSNGIARVSLRSPAQIGTATVTASTAGLSSATQVTFIAGAPASVVLSAAPATVQPGGTSSIRATVFDQKGNRVSNVTISFSVPTDSVKNGARFSVTTINTDDNGEAATQYSAPTTGVSDTITAKTTSGLSATANITLSSSTAVITGLSLDAATTTVSANGSVVLRATVQTSSGSLTGIPVHFSAASGTLNAPSATTDASGVAAVTLTAPADVGPVQLSASVGNYTAQTQVTVVPGAASSIVVSIASSPVVPGGTATITAQVLDAANNPIGAGQLVRFNHSAGNTSGWTLSAATAVTNANGNVSVTFTAGTAIPTGYEQFELVAGNASKLITISVDPSAKAIGSISLQLANATMSASGSQTVIATVKDSNGTALAGQLVNFSATAGSFTSASASTSGSGQATVQYNAPDTAGAVTLTAASGGFSSSANVTVGAGTVHTVSVSAAPSTVAPSGVSSVTALVTDASGNPIGSHAVKFTASSGTFASSTASTNGNGLATVSFTAPSSGSASITATATPENVSGTTTINVDSSGVVSVGSLTLTALTGSIPADGSSKATIRAHVTAADGSALVGQGVLFNASAGTPNTKTVPTDASGNADFVLTAGTEPGTATIKADIGGFTQTVNVTFTAGAPKTVSLALNPSSVALNGTTTLTATVLDAKGNPVSGATVNFSVPENNSLGSLASSSVPSNGSGVATTTYTAGGTVSANPDKLQASVTGATAGTALLTVVNPAKSVTLIVSSPQLLSSASTAAQGVTLMALVKNQSNNVVVGIPVEFVAQRNAASSCGAGGAVQVINGTTNAAGQATAVLTTGGDPTNQIIDVTAQASGISSTVAVPETGTTIAINGPSSVGLSAKQSFTINFKDAGNNPISNQVLTVASSLGNTIAAHAGSNCSGGNCTTDANGQFTIDYTGNVGGSDTLTVRPLNCSNDSTAAQQAVQVAAQTLTVVAPADDTQIPFSAASLSMGVEVAAGGSGYVVGDVLTVSGGTPNTAAQLIVSKVDSGGVITGVTVSNAGDYVALPASPASVTGGNGAGATFTVWQNITARLAGGTVNGQTISFNTTRGVLSSSTAVTNASGIAKVQINQPSAAGNSGGGIVTATCTSCSPNISASTGIQFNATTAAKVNLQASPSTVSVKGTSVITATVRDANDNPVANRRVNFTLTDDSGGGLLQSTAVTNSSGEAVVTYQGGPTTGSKDGVKITGTTVIGAISGSTSLTVGGQALRILPGTGNTIEALNATQYRLPYSVQVTDSAGNPPPAGSVVNLTINAIAYQKGYERWNGKIWTVDSPGSGYLSCATGNPAPNDVAGGCETATSWGCYNEDRDFNGIFNSAIDNNYNGNKLNGNPILDPGAPASVPVSVALDASGTGSFFITYLKDRAYWVQVRLTASISANGDQGRTFVDFVLPGLADDFTTETVAPPGQTSPYGKGTSCGDPN